MALPLTAVLALNAGANEMGLLRAAETVPILLFSLAVGVWIDRTRRRQLVITANVGRGLALAAVPTLALTGALRLELLYAIAFVFGVFEVIFIVAYQAFLPALVRREHLADANSRLQVSETSAQIAGPALAGILVSAVTAPIAIAVSAVSFVASAGSIARIATVEPPPAPRTSRSALGEIREGTQALLGHPVLRPVVLAAIAGVFAFSMYLTIVILYHARALGLEPGIIGVVFAIGGAGGLLGAATAPALARRLGLGPAIVTTFSLGTAGILVTASASGPPLVAAAIAALGQLALLYGFAFLNVIVPTLRQTVTPRRLLGRVNATYRFLVWGTVPIGSLVGGLVGELYGLRAPLFTAAAIDVVIIAAFLTSPVARLRAAPPPASE